MPSSLVKICVLNREFCFQLTTPSRIYYFSGNLKFLLMIFYYLAETHKLMFEWINVLRKSWDEEDEKEKNKNVKFVFKF